MAERDKWFYTYTANSTAGGSTSVMMPIFVTDALKGNMGHVGMVTAATSVASVPSFILWGSISDSMKRRKLFVMLGFFGTGLALLLMGLATSIEHFYAANFLLGLLATASAPVGIVLIMESYKETDWATKIGQFSKMGGIGWVAGILLGVFWLQIVLAGVEPVMAMRSLFVFGALLSFISMFLAYRWISEPSRKVDRKRLKPLEMPIIIFERARHLPSKVLHYLSADLRGHRLEKTTALYFFSSLVFFTGFNMFYVVFPIFLRQDAGFSLSDIFLVYLASSIFAALFYARAGKWVKRFGSKRMQSIALSSRVLLLPSFLLAVVLPMDYLPKLVLVIVLHAVMGLCWAVINVASQYTVSRLAPEGEGGEYTGLANAIQGISSIIGALFGGILALHFGFAILFATASVFVSLGLAILIILKIE